MPIGRAEVERVAALARLALDEEETERLARDLARILEHVERFRALDLGAVEPTGHVIALANAFRGDDARRGLTREEALYNAPETESGLFVVPKILREREE